MLLQTAKLAGTLTVGVGFTVIVYDDVVPGQLLTVGVTVIVAVTGDVPELVALKEGTLPEPDDANPIEVIEFVHVSVPPVGTVGQLVAGTITVLQTAKLAGTLTVGVGLTVIVYVEAVPAHPLTVGVTVMVALIGAVPGLVAVNEAIFPVPLEANPIAVLEFVHVKVPPTGVLVKDVAGTLTELQTETLAGTLAVGVGYTVIV